MDTCNNLDINSIGKIQKFGYVITISKNDMKVCHVSNNICDLPFSILSEPTDFIDRYLNTCFIPETYNYMSKMIKELQENKNETFQECFVFEDNSYSLNLNETSSVYMFEILSGPEPHDINIPFLVGKYINEVFSADTKEEMLNVVFNFIRENTEYQRIIYYVFNPDFTGEVINEWMHVDIEDKIDPFIGLTFPSSDFPLPARLMYTSKPLRVINDTFSESIDIIGKSTLNLAKLISRGVHDVHIKYSRNMGILSSLSFGLFRDSDLVGIISCHSYDHVVIPNYNVCKMIEFLCHPFSKTLSRLENYRYSQMESSLNESLNIFSVQLDLETYIFENHIELMKFTGMDCVSILKEGNLPISYGDTVLVDSLNDLRKIKEIEHDYSGNICKPLRGVIYIQYFDDTFIVFYKKARIIETKWGGDPYHEKKIDDKGIPQPRTSFKKTTVSKYDISPRTEHQDRVCYLLYERFCIILESNMKPLKK